MKHQFQIMVNGKWVNKMVLTHKDDVDYWKEKYKLKGIRSHSFRIYGKYHSHANFSTKPKAKVLSPMGQLNFNLNRIL